jgi:hypothetical protein
MHREKVILGVVLTTLVSERLTHLKMTSGDPVVLLLSGADL